MYYLTCHTPAATRRGSSHHNGEVARRLLDVTGERIQHMDDAGIDVQVLSVTTPGTQSLPPAEAVQLARDANDMLAATVAAQPGRFAAFATLPTPDPAAAAKELERTVCGLGFVGAMLFPRTGGLYLDHDTFRPVFEAAAGLGVPLYLHPEIAPHPVRDVYFSGFSDDINVILATGGWGWHADAGIAALRLILAGTFDRHPDLQLILGHWGEMLVFFLERADILSNWTPHLQRRVAGYITSNLNVTPSGIFSHRMLAHAIGAVGADRVGRVPRQPSISNAGSTSTLPSRRCWVKIIDSISANAPVEVRDWRGCTFWRVL